VYGVEWEEGSTNSCKTSLSLEQNLSYQVHLAKDQNDIKWAW